MAWRLAWGKDGPRRFALPAGAWRWVTYRLLEGDWHLSVTGSPLATLELAAGGRAALEAKDGVTLALRGVRRAEGVQVGVEIGGAVGGGASIYREGRRIALACTLLDAAGEALGQGPLHYG